MSASVPGALAPILAIVNGVPTTTSADVASFFGKQYRDVLRAIENLTAQLPPERLRNFAQASIEVNQPNGGKATYPAYRLTRDGFTLLAMGFTGKKALAFKLAYIDAFNRMERTLHVPALPDNASITAAQAGELATLIAERFPDGRERPYAWSRFNNHFRIARYRELPAARFDEARAYIGQMEQKALVLPALTGAPVVLSVPGPGCYTVYVSDDGATTIKSLEGRSVIDADGARRLQNDMSSMRSALAELSYRMRIVSGDENISVLAQPLRVAFEGVAA